MPRKNCNSAWVSLTWKQKRMVEREFRDSWRQHENEVLQRMDGRPRRHQYTCTGFRMVDGWTSGIW